MKKIVIHGPGGYEKLRLEEHPDLTAVTPDTELVDVHSIGVNYADCCVRWGVYESAKQYVGWPITPGFEFSGVARRTGEKVMGVTRFNAYATQVAVSKKHLYTIPEGFTMEQAAGFPAVFMTAYHALFQLVRLPNSARILIHSAGGGVGSALVQLARQAGLSTVGVVGSSHKVDYVRALGADQVIDKSAFSGSAKLWKAIRELCPQGYDAVLDANGPTTLRQSYEVLRPTGKLIAYGSHSMLPKGGLSGRLNYLKAAWGLFTIPRFNPMDLFTDNKSVIGFNLSFLFERDDLITEGMGALLELARQKKIAPPSTRSFLLQDVAEAHRFIESGQSTGKLVLLANG